MKYRLKDRELQRKLDALSDENRFSDHLQRECESVKKWGSTFIQVFFGPVAEPFGMSFTANFRLCDIEEVREYDPHAWNKYPEVEPPKDVWMRCENVYGSEPERLERFAARYTSQYEDGEWVDAWFSNGLRRDVTSFRPWDEEDEECQSK